LNTLALLIQHSRWPPALAEGAYDAAFRAVNGCRDFVQVKASVAVVVGLLGDDYRADPSLAGKLLGFVLQLLGHKFPKVQQAAGQALYLKLLELDSLALRAADATADRVLDEEAIDAVCELLTSTAWGGDADAVFEGRKKLYAELGLPLPKAMTQPRKAAAQRQTAAAAIMGVDARASDTAIAYAELLREEHG
jgi:hypothetical protein